MDTVPKTRVKQLTEVVNDFANLKSSTVRMTLEQDLQLAKGDVLVFSVKDRVLEVEKQTHV